MNVFMGRTLWLFDGFVSDVRHSPVIRLHSRGLLSFALVGENVRFVSFVRFRGPDASHAPDETLQAAAGL